MDAKKHIKEQIGLIMKLREVRNLFEDQQSEGLAGAVVGGVAGAAVTKSPAGAMTGAKVGSALQDTFSDNESKLSEAKSLAFNGKQVNLGSIEIEGVDSRDYPDFADAYVSYAEYVDGTQLTDEELEQFTNENGDLVNELASESMQGAADDAYDRYKDSQYEDTANEADEPVSMEKVPTTPKTVVKVGDRQVEFADDKEAKHFMDLAKLGGIKVEQVTVSKEPAQPQSVVKTDDGQQVKFSNDSDAQQFAQKVKQGQAQVAVQENDAEPNPVASAITRRIITSHSDLLLTYGPEAVGQAIDDVAEFVGDVDEIGSSDVSAYVNRVITMLKSSVAKENIAESAVAEKAVSKQQQKFMGMVYAAKKGEKPASPEVAKVAKGMTKKAAKDYASTKHKGLPKKVSESIETLFEEQAYVLHVDNAHDFDLDEERGIDRVILDVFKDLGEKITVDPHEMDSSKAVVTTDMDINEVVDILDKNGIDAHVIGGSNDNVDPNAPVESISESVLDDSDDSGFMAKSNLYAMIKDAVKLHEMIQDRDNLEGWVEEKITLATDYIKTVRDYLEYNTVRGMEQPEQPEAPEVSLQVPAKPSVDFVKDDRNPIVDSKELDDILRLSSLK